MSGMPSPNELFCARCRAPLIPTVPGHLCPDCLGSELFFETVRSGAPGSGTDRHTAPRVGDYELHEELGRGGMGVVYRARQMSLNRPVAVKLILTGAMASSVERQRFLAEAAAAAALDHPGIVSIYEAGQDDGQPFFAMQLIEGESLSAFLRRTARALPPRDAARMILRVALAVQHAHERGFLHRDLKPGNILLDEQQEPHVTDFGLARRMDADSHLTLTGAAVGTPSYMAPEQTDTRQPPTTAVDVYSLGAIFYELLSGAPPFRADSLPELFTAIREKEPASISSVHTEVDRDLDIICRKCLEKEPPRRYRSAQALADDLQRWLSGEPITARAVGKAERLWRWCRRRPAVAGLAAAALVIFLAGLTGVLWQWNRANAALHDARETMWVSNRNEARAWRVSGERGQRTRSMEAIRSAAAYRPTMELRNEAIAALALPDLGDPALFPPLPPRTTGAIHGNDALTQIMFTAGGKACFQRLADGHILASFELPELSLAVASPDHAWLFTVHGAKDETGGRTGTLWRVADQSKVWEAASVGRLTAAFTHHCERIIFWRAGHLEVRETAVGSVLAATPCVDLPHNITPQPDGSRATVTFENRWELWTLAPLASAQVLPPLEGGLWSFDWHPWDGTVMVGTSGFDVYHVRPALNTARSYMRHPREGTIVLMHPSGNFTLTTAWDGYVRIAHPALPDSLMQTRGFRFHRFSADGNSLLVLNGNRPGICAVTPPDVWRVLPLPPDAEITDSVLHFSPDGKWLSVLTGQSLTLWDPVKLRAVAHLKLGKAYNGFFTGSRTMIIHDATQGLYPLTLEDTPEGGVTLRAGAPLPVDVSASYGFALSPDGTRLFSRAQRPAVFDTRTGAELFPLEELAMPAGIAWSPDGKWLATGRSSNAGTVDGNLCLWSAEDGKLVTRLTAGKSAPRFTPDGKRLLVSDQAGITEFETGTWKELRRYPLDTAAFNPGPMDFAPEAGLMALMADEATIRLVSMSTGEELARLTQPLSPTINAWGLALSRDGNWLACDAQRTVRLWNLKLLREKLHEAGLGWNDQPPAAVLPSQLPTFPEK